MTIKNVKNILIAPLDWGLGHTTRCVPLIRYILQLGHNVLFAGNESQRAYMQATIPGITCLHLDGYNVSYTQNANTFMLKIMQQVPSILRVIKEEYKWLKKIVAEHNIDAVISDNRYGLYHTNIPCVIMTHQLQVLSGKGWLVDELVRRVHSNYLEKFDECWVVDVPEQPGLAGKLSHPDKLPANCKYMGLLSQLQPTQEDKNGYLLVLLSGPEPQRGMLSATLWAKLSDYNGRVVFVEGNKDAVEPTSIPGHITYYKLLTHDRLEATLNGADLVICRSGYSTVMDLVRLRKKAILIPTPGQTEQQYLAENLQERNWFMTKPQSSFNLHTALSTAEGFPFLNDLSDTFDDYKVVLNSWLNK